MGKGSAVGRVLRLILIGPLSGLNNDPVLLRRRSFQVVYYGVFAALNTFLTASMLLFYLHAKGHAFKTSLFLILGFCWAGGVVGIKLFHVVTLGRAFFEDVKALLVYLKQEGWKISQRTLYRHIKGGLIRPGSDGRFSMQSVRSYTKAHLMAEGTVQKLEDEQLQRTKLKKEIELRDEEIKIRRIKRMIEEGKYFLKDDPQF